MCLYFNFFCKIFFFFFTGQCWSWRWVAIDCYVQLERDICPHQHSWTQGHRVEGMLQFGFPMLVKLGVPVLVQLGVPVLLWWLWHNRDVRFLGRFFRIIIHFIFIAVALELFKRYHRIHWRRRIYLGICTHYSPTYFISYKLSMQAFLYSFGNYQYLQNDEHVMVYDWLACNCGILLVSTISLIFMVGRGYMKSIY